MHIHIAKTNGVLWSGEATSLYAPGSEGDMTILAHHVPLVTKLRPGRLIVKKDDEEVFVHEVERGVLEVTATSATVLL